MCLIVLITNSVSCLAGNAMPQHNTTSSSTKVASATVTSTTVTSADETPARVTRQSTVTKTPSISPQNIMSAAFQPKVILQKLSTLSLVLPAVCVSKGKSDTAISTSNLRWVRGLYWLNMGWSGILTNSHYIPEVQNDPPLMRKKSMFLRKKTMFQSQSRTSLYTCIIAVVQHVWMGWDRLRQTCIVVKILFLSHCFLSFGEWLLGGASMERWVVFEEVDPIAIQLYWMYTSIQKFGLVRFLKDVSYTELGSFFFLLFFIYCE